MCTFVYKDINSQTMGKKRPDDLGSHFRMHTKKNGDNSKQKQNLGVKIKNDGEGNGNPLQYSCLGKSMGRGAWQAAVHGATRLSLCARG